MTLPTMNNESPALDENQIIAERRAKLAATHHQYFVAVGEHLVGVRQAFAGFADGQGFHG